MENNDTADSRRQDKVGYLLKQIKNKRNNEIKENEKNRTNENQFCFTKTSENKNKVVFSLQRPAFSYMLPVTRNILA